MPLANPFRPGAGHTPPYLAGRAKEKEEFVRLLAQHPVLDNLILTGLRGVGKTVLLETFRPLAREAGWLWAGTDLAEAATVSEQAIATRLLADLAPLVANVKVNEVESARIGFATRSERRPVRLSFELLESVFQQTPGLVSDKLKATLALIWASLEPTAAHGIVLAYDEAQNLRDQAATEQYPLSLLLDVFQSIQKRGIPMLLVLTGLPTLFAKLVEARTFAERMFHVATLDRLTADECRDAIQKPIEASGATVRFTPETTAEIIAQSGGYPYFVQFLCRELFDSCLQQQALGVAAPTVAVAQCLHKLDSDFFAGRWSRVTERQRALLTVIAGLPRSDEEFTVQEVVAASRQHLSHPFSASHASQLLARLIENGLVFKNRHGRYSFAIPMLGGFLRRQQAAGQATPP
jgi:hypothetical protein